MTLSKEPGFQKPQKQEKDYKKENKALLLRLAVSTGAGLVVFVLLQLAAAAMCLAMDLPQERLAWAGIPLAALAAFWAGYMHVRPRRKQGLLLGLLSGAAIFAAELLLVFLISRAPLGPNAVLLLLATLFGGSAGGIFAANRRPAERQKSAKRGYTKKRRR